MSEEFFISISNRANSILNIMIRKALDNEQAYNDLWGEDGAVYLIYADIPFSNPKKYIDELVTKGLILRHPDWTGEGRSIYFIVHWEYIKKVFGKV